MKIPPYSKLIQKLLDKGYIVRTYEYTDEHGTKVKKKIALKKGEKPSPDKYIVDVYKKEFGHKIQTGGYSGLHGINQKSKNGKV